MVRIASVLAVLANMALAVNQASAQQKVYGLLLGDPCPAFANLPGVDGKNHSLPDYKKDVLVVCVLRNSCPESLAHSDGLIAFNKKYGDRVDFVAIYISNTGRDDDKLPQIKKDRGFNFPCLYDESKATSRSLGAKVTPHFFVFNKERKLIYKGAMDDNVRKPTMFYLNAAVEAGLKGENPKVTQTKANGCPIAYPKQKAQVELPDPANVAKADKNEKERREELAKAEEENQKTTAAVQTPKDEPAREEENPTAKDGLWDGLTQKLNKLANWTIAGGEWKEEKNGLLGKGNSILHFKERLPSDFQLEFDMTVIAGSRPRVHFHWNSKSPLYFGTEGNRLALFPYGSGISQVNGTPSAYRHNEVQNVKVIMVGDKAEFWTNGKLTASGKRSLQPVELALSPGDGFSGGPVRFFNFKISAAPKKDDIVAQKQKEEPGKVKKDDIVAQKQKEEPGKVKKDDIVAQKQKEEPGKVKKDDIVAQKQKEEPGKVKKDDIVAQKQKEEPSKVEITPPLPAQEPGKWHHLDLANAKAMGDFLRITPGKDLPTKKAHSGPVEITVVARTDKDEIRLLASRNAFVIFNWEGKPGELRIHRPDGEKEHAGSLAVSKQVPLQPNTWYTLRWTITGEGMEVAVDNKVVFSEKRTFDLSKETPILVKGEAGSVIDVKSVVVAVPKDGEAKAPRKADTWSHLDISETKVMEGFVHIPKGKSIATKETFAGPIEIAVVARMEGTENNAYDIRLAAFAGGMVFLNRADHPDELRVHRPDGNDVGKGLTSATAPFKPVAPNTWATFKWLIEDHGMTVTVDDKVVFSEKGQKYSFAAAKRQISFIAVGTAADVKSFEVRHGHLENVAQKPKEEPVAKEGIWDHLDLTNAKPMDDFLRITPGKELLTKKAHSGPVEITVVARTDKDNVRLVAYKGGNVTFGLPFNPGQLRIDRPGDDSKKKVILPFNKVPLKPNTWYTFRWHITEEGMEVAVDNKVVFTEKRQYEQWYDLSAAYPIRVSGATKSVIIDVKSVVVVPLAATKPTEKQIAQKKKKELDKQLQESRAKAEKDSADRIAREAREKREAEERRVALVRKEAADRAERERSDKLAKQAEKEKAERDRQFKEWAKAETERQAKFAKEWAEALERVKKEKDYLPPVKLLEAQVVFDGVKTLLGQPTETQRNLLEKNADAVLCIWDKGKNGYVAIYFVNGVRGGILGYGVDRQRIDDLKRIMRGELK